MQLGLDRDADMREWPIQSEASGIDMYMEGFVDPQSHIHFLCVAPGDCVGAPGCANNVMPFAAGGR